MDVLDCVAYAIKLVPTPRSEDDVASERRSAEAKRVAHKPRTFTTANYGGY